MTLPAPRLRPSRPALHRGAILGLAFALISSLAAAQATPYQTEAQGASPGYLAAAGEILGNNALVNLFDRLTEGRGTWADATIDSWETTLLGPWHFDQDPWMINEIEHPIEGALYFTTGRMNGLGFWGSAAGTVFGELMWKLFGEVDDPNINDMVTTTFSGVVLGEMAHRLYIEATRGGARPQASPRLALSFEAGLAAPFIDPSAPRGLQTGFGGITGELGDTLVYGDAFGRHTAPFDYFEQRFDVELSPSFWGLAFFSDGTLFALPVLDSHTSELSIAASLHEDFVYNSLVELEANAIGLSALGEERTRSGARLSGELHLNAIVLGTSENAYLREFYGAQSVFEEGRDYDWGFGEGAKLHLGISDLGGESFDLDYSLYCINAMPGTVSADAPLEYAIVGILDLAYDHRLSDRLSLGTAYTLYLKSGFYSSLPGTYEYLQALTLFAKMGT
jgi:hypothetical protein